MRSRLPALLVPFGANIPAVTVNFLAGTFWLRTLRGLRCSRGQSAPRDWATWLYRVENEHRDPTVRGTSLVLRPTGVDPQCFFPDLAAPVALGFNGAEAA